MLSLFAALWRGAVTGTLERNHEGAVQFLRDFVGGKLSLGTAFVSALFINFFGGFFLAAVVQALGPSATGTRIALSMCLVAWAVACIGQWRCASNTQLKYMGTLARAWVVISVLAAFGNLMPLLPEAIRQIVGLSILLGIVYFVSAPIRDFMKLQIYKRKSQPKD